MTPAFRVVPVRLAPGTSVDLRRKTLQRYLIGYLASRGLRPRPDLRELLIAAVDVYPEGFPARADALSAHIDRVLGLTAAAPDAHGEIAVGT